MEKYFENEWENAWVRYVSNHLQNYGISYSGCSQTRCIEFRADKIFCSDNAGRNYFCGIGYGFNISHVDEFFQPQIPCKTTNHNCVKLMEKYKIATVDVWDFKTHKMVVHVHYRCTINHFIGRDVLKYAERCILQTIIVSIHEQQCEWFAENHVERYFADDYLLSLLFQYLCIVYD